MLKNQAALLCLVYIGGLLCTGLPGAVWGIPVGAIAPLVLGLGMAIAARWLRKLGLSPQLGLGLGVISCIAFLYYHWVLPAPTARDISQWVNDPAIESVEVTVVGQIESPPRLTQSQKIQFQLTVTAAQAASQNSPQPSVGSLYVTVPLLQGTGLHPGQRVQVSGALYRPPAAMNPGGFDFAAYLRQQGIFAGLRGRTVELQPAFSLTLGQQIQTRVWQIQQRIIQAQVQGLGVPEGPLLSAMIIGRNGVDLSYDLKTQFSQVGLAHALAASGFQVSLLISVVLGLTGRSPAVFRFWLGIGLVTGYMALTGLQPAVLRAALMGVAALFALTTERKVKSFGVLLLAATILLIIKPIWIWDLGFQFSFLATLGLLVTVPGLTRWLDWLPSGITPLIAVPLAAYLWTLPLQLGTFGVVSPYSIPLNILSTPLITVISFGGMASGLAALIHPALGSAIAPILYYPTHWLITLVQWGSQLPGSSLAVGRLSGFGVWGLYGLIAIAHAPRPVLWGTGKWWKRRGWIAAIAAMSLVMLPAWHRAFALSQATILATSGAPVMVVQNQGEVGLINTGNAADVQFTVLPFLRQQGINQIDWAIATEPLSSNPQAWLNVMQTLPVKRFYRFREKESIAPATEALLTAITTRTQATTSLAPGTSVAIGTSHVQVLSVQPSILQLQTLQQSWLISGAGQWPQTLSEAIAQKATPSILWWSGQMLSSDGLATLPIQMAIASPRPPAPETAAWLEAHHIPVYSTAAQGAVQWQPQQGLKTLSNLSPNF